MQLYISGPITPTPGHSLEENSQAFHDAKEYLTRMGHDVVSPLEIPACADSSCGSDKLFRDGAYQHTWKCYMRTDLAYLALHCDTIAMLPRWTESKGATCEYQVAAALEYKILFLDQAGMVIA